MAAPRDLLEVVTEIVLRETRYLRHYAGQVTSNDDPLQAGRVRARVPELGWMTDAVAPWCRPRDKHAMVVPAVGEWVEVYFVDGNQSRAVYQGVVSEMREMLPKAFDGRAGTVVLWQDTVTGDSIVYDASVPEIRILGKGDNLVTYKALAQAMTNLVGIFNGHTHPVTSAPGTTGVPNSTMSDDISGAKARRLRTDG